MGYYEPKLCRYLQSKLHKEAVFIDIGAHAGYLSLFAAGIATNGSVISFEPEPDNRQFIKQIISLNKLQNWKLIEKAAGNEMGTIRFATGPTSSMGKVSAEGGIEVKSSTLDEELSELKRVDLIKIDVEGFGGRVIEGSLNVIERFKPVILMEIHSGSDELAMALKHLTPGYNLADLNTGEFATSTQATPHFIIATPNNKFS